ncbi:DUF4783 domain-containing protein [Pedobacter changchengzhani]|uniref:DUF4783 domain-containing protein n=1 Tax=Pedobacter changchengzhani TaxID=2529274 RepID=A0A4R5MM50_9SPHI|nr:DUF4783 domain-containing protein [Pedobacter changchengzhani]TDG36586.1 DUF4783 domain-containing protein [Pedobacter changchengzhani]
MIRSLFIFLVAFIPISHLSAPQTDIVDDLSTFFKAGDSKNIAKNFSTTIELVIGDEEDVYSKLQGEQILKDFFAKFPPTKSTISHKINTNPNYRFGVIILNTAKDVFRVSVTMKKINNSFLITELRIEQVKN